MQSTWCRWLINESRKCKISLADNEAKKKSTWRWLALFTKHDVAQKGFNVKTIFVPNEPTSCLNKRKTAHRNTAMLMCVLNGDVLAFGACSILCKHLKLQRASREEKKFQLHIRCRAKVFRWFLTKDDVSGKYCVDNHLNDNWVCYGGDRVNRNRENAKSIKEILSLSSKSKGHELLRSPAQSVAREK